MQNSHAKKLTRAGIIASLYAVTTLVTMPIASGAIQIRLSEALTLLPLLYLEAVPALAVGCLISNLISGCALWDIVFGSIITLVAALLTFCVGKIIKNKWAKIIIGGLFPVLLNAFLLPLIWLWCYGVIEYMYIIQVLFLLAGQSISVYAFGISINLGVTRLKEKGFLFLQ